MTKRSLKQAYDLRCKIVDDIRYGYSHKDIDIQSLYYNNLDYGVICHLCDSLCCGPVKHALIRIDHICCDKIKKYKFLNK